MKLRSRTKLRKPSRGSVAWHRAEWAAAFGPRTRAAVLDELARDSYAQARLAARVAELETEIDELRERAEAAELRSLTEAATVDVLATRLGRLQALLQTGAAAFAPPSSGAGQSN